MTEGPTRTKAPSAAPAIRALAVVMAAVVGTASTPAAAQNLPQIRDAEIEALLRDYTQPILRAAGLGKQNIRVVIVNDRSFNAFVADGRRIFMNAGAILDAQNPNQVIGVLAHETGHIAGGHLAKLRDQMESASTAAIIAMLLGAGAMVASSQSRNASGSNIGAAAIQAPTDILMRSLISYQRAHEEQADRAGVKFLSATNQSAKGMYDTFKRLADQVLYSSRGSDPYAQSHPMPRERIASLEELAKNSPLWEKKDPAELQARHDLARAKLSGFLERHDSIARRYPMSDVSIPAKYARAISAYRFSNPAAAVEQIDALIQAQPGNAYFHELKGQALLEAGRPAQAVAPLRKAVQLSSNPALIQVLLAQALLGTNDAKSADEAASLLRAALTREPESVEAYTHLAMAYGRKGAVADADLAAAQAAAMRGDINTARQLAMRAKTKFAVGSPGWVKADDISSFRPGERPRNPGEKPSN